MKKILRSLCIGFSLIALSLGTFTGCNEEDGGDAQKPFIFEQIEILYGLVGSGTGASKDFSSQLERYSNSYKDALGMACDDYNSDLNTAKSAITLATKQRNSGFYTSMYILLVDMEKKAASNQSTREFENLFKTAGCITLLEDAKKVVTERDNKSLKL